jgi:hypothetical protein
LLLYTKNLLIDELLNNARGAGTRHRGVVRLQVVCESLLPLTKSARMAWLVLTAFNGRAIGDKELTAIQISRYTKCRKFFAVQVLFLNRNETKRAKEELVQRYLERSFAIPPLAALRPPLHEDMLNPPIVAYF